MEDIIAPISKELLKAELTEDKRLRMTMPSRVMNSGRSNSTPWLIATTR